jgi:hypothetical protein
MLMLNAPIGNEAGGGVGHGLDVEAIDDHAQEALDEHEQLKGAQATPFDNHADVELIVHERIPLL